MDSSFFLATTTDHIIEKKPNFYYMEVKIMLTKMMELAREIRMMLAGIALMGAIGISMVVTYDYLEWGFLDVELLLQCVGVAALFGFCASIVAIFGAYIVSIAKSIHKKVTGKF